MSGRRLLVAVLAVAVLAALSAAPRASAVEPPPGKHPGPFGLKWGKASPKKAKTVLAKKLKLVSEGPAEGLPEGTVDQHYSGDFGGMPTSDIFLRFFDGKFFYMMVTLATPDPAGVSQVWAHAVELMGEAYGKPQKLHPAPQLASSKSIVDNLPLTTNRDYVLPMLWNERTHQDEETLFQLRDLQVRSGLWDPFADWRFTNKVTVQTFIHQQATEGGGPPILEPIWIFVQDELFKKWKLAPRFKPAKAIPKVIEPRDY